ncbi:DUF3618 domain-containing protein [Luteimicrobium subarcticum]|uniref:Uncharacterized protein DUF3618 n=1 Tax=Luteimicrobium subarcticum TaxID=620910 RepID=A0A2M8WSN5_9MICO|nr:DUF3618 domain-containing protein [Luteimicrobium subarcticum]PJI93846.1 uncharacterized protein DUF3618 [Luteimicrobium subarcticum]
MSTKQQQLEIELAKARSDLAASVDVLATRLDPRSQARDLADSVKQTVSDTGGLFTGRGMPDQARRSRNVKVALGVAAVVLALGLRVVLRRP